MTKCLAVALLLLPPWLAGCNGQAADYVAASAISKGGFARDPVRLRAAQGEEIRVWGFVDHGNLYGDPDARRILAEWWSGEGPDPGTWRFNLKAGPDDAVGRSFAVHVRNDADRDALLAALVADARARRPTRVWVRGRLAVFDAPTQGADLTGLYLEVGSSRAVRLAPPGAP